MTKDLTEALVNLVEHDEGCHWVKAHEDELRLILGYIAGGQNHADARAEELLRALDVIKWARP